MASPNVFSRKSLFTVTQLVGAMAGIGLAKSFGFGGLMPFVAAALAFGAIVGILISKLESRPRAQLVVSVALLLTCLCIGVLFQNFRTYHAPEDPETAVTYPWERYAAQAPKSNVFDQFDPKSIPAAPVASQQSGSSELAPGYTVDSTPPSGAQPVPEAIENAQWNGSVAMLFQEHPALRFQHNTALFQEHLNVLTSPAMTDQQRLLQAYTDTVNDLRWASTP